tara:strand:- start:2330 stop:2668 length:339 start_codon:yes stop_codon:yes gene_type:complete
MVLSRHCSSVSPSKQVSEALSSLIPHPDKIHNATIPKRTFLIIGSPFSPFFYCRVNVSSKERVLLALQWYRILSPLAVDDIKKMIKNFLNQYGRHFWILPLVITTYARNQFF